MIDLTLQQIKDNAPDGADHYMKSFGKIKYLKKTERPTFMTRVVQFLFRIKPL